MTRGAVDEGRCRRQNTDWWWRGWRSQCRTSDLLGVCAPLGLSPLERLVSHARRIPLLSL